MRQAVRRYGSPEDWLHKVLNVRVLLTYMSSDTMLATVEGQLFRCAASIWGPLCFNLYVDFLGTSWLVCTSSTSWPWDVVCWWLLFLQHQIDAIQLVLLCGQNGRLSLSFWLFVTCVTRPCCGEFVLTVLSVSCPSSGQGRGPRWVWWWTAWTLPSVTTRITSLTVSDKYVWFLRSRQRTWNNLVNYYVR